MPQIILQCIETRGDQSFIFVVFWSYVLLPNNLLTQQKGFHTSGTVQSLLKGRCYPMSSHFIYWHDRRKTDMVCQ